MTTTSSMPCGCKPCDGGCAPEMPLNGIHYCAQHDCDTHAKTKLAAPHSEYWAGCTCEACLDYQHRENQRVCTLRGLPVQK